MHVLTEITGAFWILYFSYFISILYNG